MSLTSDNYQIWAKWAVVVRSAAAFGMDLVAIHTPP